MSQDKDSIPGDHTFTKLIPQKLTMVKEKCRCDMQGYRLRIVYDDITDTGETYCDYSFEPVFKASDSIKIRILRQLLDMMNDTSICCKKVKRYGSVNVKHPHSLDYTLQIDALFTFNFIVFGVYSRSYSPYPVLYDTVTNLEINYDKDKIHDVYTIYKNWLDESIQKGFKDFIFPLVNTRYRWYGGSKKIIVLREMPRTPVQSNLGNAY
jgi:hypothetical protein